MDVSVYVNDGDDEFSRKALMHAMKMDPDAVMLS